MRRGAFLALVAVVLVATSCSGSASTGRLLLAGDTSGSQDASAAAGTSVWAVQPGEQPSAGNRLATGVAGPLSINSVNVDGTVARDSLGTIWNGETLLSYQDAQATSLATVGQPGAEQTTIARSGTQLQANVLQRGVFLAADDRCSLARSADDVSTVGRGLCSVSEDERWVVSWPVEGGRLTIRDLRTGKVRNVEGTTTDAVALGRGASMLAIQEVGGGKRGVVIDATTGQVRGRTDAYAQIRTFPVTVGATGFTALAAVGAGAGGSPTGAELLWIDTSGKAQVVDRGLFMLPVHTDSTVTYVRIGEARPGTDSIRRWDPGTGDRIVLLSGRVGAAAAGADDIVATRDTDRGVELYRPDGHGGLQHATTWKVDTGSGSSVGRVLTQGGTAFVELSAGGSMALARIDLDGDGSDVPIRGWAQLALNSVDTDGTALLTGVRSADASRQSIGVVTPSSDSFVERITAGVTGQNLIHEGVIYVTDQTADGTLRVRSVRAQGKPEPTTLFLRRQIAGATWPTDNGATVSTFVSRVALLQAQQQSQQQQAPQEQQPQAQPDQPQEQPTPQPQGPLAPGTSGG